jgi:hypothetical protein
MSINYETMHGQRFLMKDLKVAVGRWWRWTRYEIRDGYIRPAPGARLQVYDPWKVWLETRPLAKNSDQQKLQETPYQALLTLLGELRYRQPGDIPLDFTPRELNLMLASLTADSEKKILEWCARYGLLGVLPHRALRVTLAPQKGSQIQYAKIGAGWIATERAEEQQSLETPCAVLQPLRGTGVVAEPLSTTWSRFFPDVRHDQRENFSYPEPLTKDFWMRYAEPLADFLSGMHALRELHQAIRLFQAKSAAARRFGKLQAALAGGPELMYEGLVAGVGLALQWKRSRQFQLKWVAGSLLASLTMMMLQDLSYGRALQCPGCGRAFVSGAYQARYCSVRCRWLVQKREYRTSRRSSDRLS